jgi:hypothetical protein
VARLRTVALALLLVVTSSGTAAVEVPRLPCAGATGLTLHLDPPPRQVWLENGQCVGFLVPDASGAGFGPIGSPARAGEALLGQILRDIGTANRQATGGDVVTIVFLAPLSRSSPDSVINALNQLDGAAGAQRLLNSRTGSTRVRLVVANAGEDFVSGRAVATALRRAFPATGQGALRAVIGLSQSRSSTLAAVQVLTAGIPGLQVMGASVNGDRMQSGSPQQPGPGEAFHSVAPGDDQVAQAMVTMARAGHPADIQVIYEPADTFFSAELAADLSTRLGRDIDTGPGRDPEISETSGTDLGQVVNTMCSPASAATVWLFAGRATQLLHLGQRLPCEPRIIAGPGGLSLMADPDHGSSGHWGRLSFYSLTAPGALTLPARTFDGSQRIVPAARTSEYATGYAAVLAVVPRVGGTTSCEPRDAMPFAVRFGDNGLNDLGQGGGEPAPAPSAGTCAGAATSAVLFCAAGPQATAPDGGCRPATDQAPPAPGTPRLATVVNGGVRLRASASAGPGAKVLASLPAGATVQVECRQPAVSPADPVQWVRVRPAAPAPGGPDSGYIGWTDPTHPENLYLRFENAAAGVPNCS